MTRSRRQPLIIVAVAALFALTGVAPRAVFVRHSHAGGEHTHAHADLPSTAELLAELHGHRHPHGAHHHHADGAHHHADAHEHGGDAQGHGDGAHAYAPNAAAHGGARAVVRVDDEASSHWHQQDRFQRALPAVAPPLVESGLTVAGAPVVIGQPPAAPARDLRARGPPVSHQA